jgi:hypothetical protein
MPRLEIHCKGGLDASWSDWFGGLTIERVGANTTFLTGEVMDNAAIYGVLSTMSSLGLTLISCHVVSEWGDEPRSPLAPPGRTKEE